MNRHLLFSDLAPDQPFHAGWRRPDFAFPTHSHDFYEAFLCLEGCGVHELNGAAFALRPGDLWLLRLADVHSIRPQCDFAFANVAWPVKSWTVWCDLAGIAPESGLQNVVAPHLAPLFLSMARSFATRSASPLELCRFWVEIAEATTGKARVETRPDWMLRGLQALESEAGLCAGWPLLLSSTHVSESHLCREWKRTFGVTPTQWINARRLENAARLLLQSNLPIKEISARCGFDNIAYFYRLFQKKYGAAPKAYRMKRP